MADPSPWHSDQQGNMHQDSAILEMEGVDITGDENDVSDYENSMTDSPVKGQGAGQKSGPFMEDVRQRMTENVTQMVWNAGKQSATRAWSMYGNIDILRPYFDVEPHEVQRRLLFSLIPQKPTSQRQRVPKELYGPLMVIFTLIALLLYQMKVSSHKVEEGTLMGSALLVCFSYWFGASSVVWFLSYICNVRLALLQVLSLLGYGLFGHCIVLFLGTVIHTSHDHVFFYVLWGTIGGLSTLKIACVVLSRASGRKERLIVIAVIAALHLLFLLYLHFAYHSVVEELSEMFEGHRHDPIKPDVVERIAEQGLKRKVENAAESVFEKVTKKIGAALQDGGQLLADNAGPIVQSANSSVKRVLRETLRGVRPDKIAPLASKGVLGNHLVGTNSSQLL